MKHYQGEDIDFRISLKPRQMGDLQRFVYMSEQDEYHEGNGRKNLQNITGVIVYLYTNEQHVVKYAINFESDGSHYYDEESDFLQLQIDVSKTALFGVLTTEHTRLMRGTLFADIMVTRNYGDTDKIKSINTGVEICHAPIKTEAI